MNDFADVSIDAVRSYWNARPCNVRHSPKPVGSPEYFDEVEDRKYLVEPHIPSFAEFPRWSGRRVLELGCGIGTDTINFARAGARVTAVDVSGESLGLARRRAEVTGVADRVTFVEADGECLSQTLPVEPYDLVYSFGVVHHSPHPERVVRELGRYLAPGGTLKLMVYHRYSWKVLEILLTARRWSDLNVARLVARHSEAQTGCPVTHTFTRRSARALAHLADVAVSEVHVDHIFPYRIPDYVEYRYVESRWIRWMPRMLFRAFEHAFGWHLLVTGVRPAAPESPREHGR